jgi:hypothetical protein
MLQPLKGRLSNWPPMPHEAREESGIQPTPVISVVVRTKNEAPSIGRLLDSLEAQKLEGAVEVILGTGADDSAADGARLVGRRWPLSFRLAAERFSRANPPGGQASSGWP